jgi:hypothetical protein
VRTIGWRAPGTFDTSTTFSNPLWALPPLECRRGVDHRQPVDPLFHFLG